MIARSSTLLYLLYLSINVDADNCPFRQGTYFADSLLNVDGRQAVGGCYLVGDTMYEYNSDGTQSSNLCEEAICNGVTASVVNTGETCDVTIDTCFSNQPGNGAPTSLTFTYYNFVMSRNEFIADLVGPPGTVFQIDGLVNRTVASFDLIDSAGLVLGSTLLTAETVAESCPFTDGRYTVDMRLDEQAMVVLGLCGTGQSCQPLSCDNALAIADDNVATCEMVVQACGDSSQSTRMTYGNFDVRNQSFLADWLDGEDLTIDGSASRNGISIALRDESGVVIGSVSGARRTGDGPNGGGGGNGGNGGGAGSGNGGNGGNRGNGGNGGNGGNRGNGGNGGNRRNGGNRGSRLRG